MAGASHVGEGGGGTDPLFRFTGFDGAEREMNVLETVLYLIDFDLMKLLPSLYEDMRDGFLLPGILPGGAHCMMNQVATSARPFMGPNLYLTPPGAFTHFHQDGHGTVDSGHQCLAGYNEVVMLRRMSEDRKLHSLEILNESCVRREGDRGYDAMYGLPHGDENGEKPPWPSPHAIKTCRKMNYCPSVFILKPGQFVHINKGRLHAFRKMSTSPLPSSDCHSHLRRALIRDEKITKEVVCLSIAWDWMYRGYTSDGINDELESALSCAKLNQKHSKLSLAITETSVLQSARVVVSRFEQLCESKKEREGEGEGKIGKGEEENLIPLPFCTKPSVQIVPSPLTVLKGIHSSLKRTVEGREEALINAERCRTSHHSKDKKPTLSIVSTPNAHQNPYLFDLDAYGDDFFCKLCDHELSNSYMHCNGCEELLNKDFNICTDCHANDKFKIFYHMNRDNNERDAFKNHTGDMATAEIVPPCECKKIESCGKCGHCSGCKCTCHTSFTLNFRYMSTGEERDLLRRVNAAIEQSGQSGVDPKGGDLREKTREEAVVPHHRYCGRAVRDPGAPRVNACAFILYENSIGGRFSSPGKRRPPNGAIAIAAASGGGRSSSNRVARMYKNLTEEETANWESRAREDKSRFDTQMKSYVPPQGYDVHGYRLEGYHSHHHHKPPSSTDRPSSITSSRRMRTRDPNAPLKRPPGQCELYQRAMSNHNPGMTTADKRKYLSLMYKNLTPNERSQWATRSQEYRAKWSDLIQTYSPPEGYDAQGYRMVETTTDHPQDDDPSSTTKRAKGGNGGSGGQVYDAPNFPNSAFTFFAIEVRPAVMDGAPPRKEMQRVVRTIKKRWNDVGEEERRRFVGMERDDLKRFEREMREYDGEDLSPRPTRSNPG